MFDFHRHLNKETSNTEALFCTDKTYQWKKCAPLFSLGLLQNDKIYSFEELNLILSSLEDNLKLNLALQIGEIGLDKRWGNLDKQIYFLKGCLLLREKYNRVLTLHCVKSFEILFDLLKGHKIDNQPFIILHKYTGSFENAVRLKKFNVIVSLNPDFIKTKGFNKILLFDKLGFLIESDWNEINETGYLEYFNSFIIALEKAGAYRFKEINNEFRTILKNITINR